MLRRGSGEHHKHDRHVCGDRLEDPVLAKIADDVVECRRCPRLVAYLDTARAKWPDHRCRPVPGFGDERPRLVIVGLAPGIHGAGKTGRMFTFDSSGAWVYGMLHEMGLATRPISERPGDGLKIPGVYITAAARCAPPGNKPLPAELAACRPYLEAELGHLTGARVVLALGRIAHDSILRIYNLKPGGFPFGHGAEHRLPDGRILLDSYHPSRQNTNTGRLTRPMWRAVFKRARRRIQP
ncbi:MAG TPA: uracil-DNA glycosylase [Planctomycetota bacterium]|nr:uracil-DNA glycosylase [Planctomycetota bacterium]